MSWLVRVLSAAAGMGPGASALSNVQNAMWSERCGERSRDHGDDFGRNPSLYGCWLDACLLRYNGGGRLLDAAGDRDQDLDQNGNQHRNDDGDTVDLQGFCDG